MDDLQRFKETYITECYELLEDMEGRLLEIDEAAPDVEDLNAVFRCAHSIKGGAGAFGFTRISGFTHILEEVLDAMRDGSLTVTRDAIDVLLTSADILKQMVQAAQEGQEVVEGLETESIEQLKDIAGHSGQEAEATQDAGQIQQEEDEISIFEISFIPNDNLFMTGNEPLLIIRELRELGEVTLMVDVDRVPPLAEIDPEKCYVKWNITLETEKRTEQVREVFEFVEDDCRLIIEKVAGFSLGGMGGGVSQEAEVAVQSQEVAVKEVAMAQTEAKKQEPVAKAAPAATSIRVDVDKVDRLVNMVGELVITQAMIVAQSSNLSPEKYLALLNGITHLSQHTVELQEAVMAVRMQPVKSVFSRMPRVVRDLSKKLGKDIRMETYGENTELDKTVIEQLADPLMHMIRNSVDHGIDTPQNRMKLGKPPQGCIKLSAEHRGGKIIITIEDDGRGINREKVLKIAQEKGLIPEGTKLTDEETDNLIFMAGFSTAEEVSDISGRGVGMDVVRRNIEALGGTVKVSTVPGDGSKFEVTLPLTLAILDGMVVRVGKEKYIIPIANIIETLRPRADEVQRIADANDTLNVRGEFVSVLYLYKLFDIPNPEKDPSKGLVVLVENMGERFGLMVDELIGQQQVVIKSLEENADAVPGISAATILGDGKVSLILDVSSLQRLNTACALEESKVKAHH